MTAIATTIACADCGHPYETTRGNTKVDSVCRLLRDTLFVGTQTRKCWICEAPFAAIDRRDAACADCTYQPVGVGEAVCGFCGETRLRVKRDVNVCHWCARDPENRAKLIGSLRRKQQMRREEAAT